MMNRRNINVDIVAHELAHWLAYLLVGGDPDSCSIHSNKDADGCIESAFFATNDPVSNPVHKAATIIGGLLMDRLNDKQELSLEQLKEPFAESFDDDSLALIETGLSPEQIHALQIQLAPIIYSARHTLRKAAQHLLDGQSPIQKPESSATLAEAMQQLDGGGRKHISVLRAALITISIAPMLPDTKMVAIGTTDSTIEVQCDPPMDNDSLAFIGKIDTAIARMLGDNPPDWLCKLIAHHNSAITSIMDRLIKLQEGESHVLFKPITGTA